MAKVELYPYIKNMVELESYLDLALQMNESESENKIWLRNHLVDCGDLETRQQIKADLLKELAPFVLNLRFHEITSSISTIEIDSYEQMMKKIYEWIAYIKIASRYDIKTIIVSFDGDFVVLKMLLIGNMKLQEYQRVQIQPFFRKNEIINIELEK